jgi:dihydrofolate reductase
MACTGRATRCCGISATGRSRKTLRRRASRRFFVSFGDAGLARRIVMPRHKETTMSRLRVNAFAVSIDGYGAGPDQSLQDPLGVGGTALHEWTAATHTFRRIVLGMEGGSTGIDDQYIARGFEGVGAWILGRNMFGPVRGPWPDDTWKGWWGDEPPYHVPVFVLTHHARPPIEMRGGTVFHFVTDGIEAALARARQAAQGRDVRLGGGAATIRQYLQARLVDEMHIAIAPALLGRGESLLHGLDLPVLGYRCARHEAGEGAMHVVIERDA